MISSFGSTVLSREQMKGVKGGIRTDDGGGEGSYFYRCCDDSGHNGNCSACESEQICGVGKMRVGC